MRWTYSTFLDDLWPSLISLLQTCKTTFFEHSLYILSQVTRQVEAHETKTKERAEKKVMQHDI
jgi:hypothetical protein